MGLLACGRDDKLLGTGYVVTKDGVYWQTLAGSSAFPTLEKTQRLTSADPKTFEDLPYETWGRDAQFVYYKGDVLPGADPESLRLFGNYLAADNQAVWRQGERLPGISGQGFEPLGGRYARNVQGIIYSDEIITVCDPQSFSFVGGDLDEFATDKDCAYFRGTRLPLTDRASFQFYGGGFSKDRSAVFWHVQLLDAADPDSFTVEKGTAYGRDKHGCWIGPKLQPCLKP